MKKKSFFWYLTFLLSFSKRKIYCLLDCVQRNFKIAIANSQPVDEEDQEKVARLRKILSVMRIPGDTMVCL